MRSRRLIGRLMSTTMTGSNTTAPTQLLEVNGHSYAYRRFGKGTALPLLPLPHFTRTLANWDPAGTDPLASAKEVILLDNARARRSTRDLPTTLARLAENTLA